MAYKVSDHQARYLRMLSQGLVHNEGLSPENGAQVVRAVVGIQAQEESAAYLSINSRSTKITRECIERDLFIERSLIHSWFMRATLHLVATQDLDWLLALLAPIFIHKNQRRYSQLGLNETALARGVRVIAEVLAAQGPQTRHGLAPYLARQGVNTEGQSLIYLINRAAWEGILCLGPSINGKQTYARLPDWIGRDLKASSQNGTVYLVERYLSAYGPASPKDFAAWSGLDLKLIRQAWKELEDRLVELEFPSGTGYLLSEQAEGLGNPPLDSLGVCLLPKFDTFLLGYAERSLFVSPEHVKLVNAGGGILRPVLLVNGQVRGIWHMIQGKKGVKIDVESFYELSSKDRLLLEVEIERIRKFLDTNIEFVFKKIAM